RVEVPLVAPADALLRVLGPLDDLGVLVLLDVGVVVAGGEDDLLAVGAEERAGGTADAGADPPVLPSVEVLDEDLVERVAGALLLGLVDDPPAVGGEVPLAGAGEVEGDLADVLEVCRLGGLPVLGRRLGRGGAGAGRERVEHGEYVR